MLPCLQQAHHHPPEGSPFQHHNSTSIRPNIRYDDNEIEEFYDQLQNVIDQTPKDILVVQGNWQGICGPFCNNDTNERGLRLLEFTGVYHL